MIKQAVPSYASTMSYQTGPEKLSFVWQDTIHRILKSEWDVLSHELSTPFLDWDWLSLLEESGSVTPEVGWQPQYLTVYRDGRLVAAAPLFIKTHSQGEFVFDHAWAQLAEQMGMAYYPKIVGMSPFTPIGAFRFLLAQDEDHTALITSMQAEIERFSTANRLSSCHYQFLEPGWGADLQKTGMVPWVHPGFEWINQEYESFQDFLTGFKSTRRKNIKKERRRLIENGIWFDFLHKDTIQERHLAWMYSYYVHTNKRYFPWSCKYLTEAFFLGLAQDLTDNLLLVAAYEQGRKEPVGMAMLVLKGDRLFGRYWGGQEGIPFLHFNLCYYQPIQWAIDHGMKRFDPGMGGEHKLYRGFRLVPNYSLHKAYAPALQKVMDISLQELNAFYLQRIQELNQANPFS